MYLMKIGVEAKMNREEAKKLYGLLNDLGWEWQRMSTDGQMTLNTIYEMIGIEPITPEDTLDFQYMINKVEGKDD